MTTFQRVANMNVAFGNPKGDYTAVDISKITKQVSNILDELAEFGTAAALGDLEDMRDALCDIIVFAQGAQHLMGVDGDADMHAVVDGVMTRFVKNDEDKAATIALHAKKGVTDVYFEGEYPKMVMKSASAQPDAPTGKFLKSASYTQPVFPEI